MFTAQPGGKQTMAFSRIPNPQSVLSTDAVAAHVKRGRNPKAPIRNLLAGADLGTHTSLFARLHAWFRGER